MDYALLFPGRFLKAADFKGKWVNLTITGVRVEDLPQDGGANKVKGIIAFAETKKELVLNRTNAECFKALWGRETDEWVGKKVSLFPAIWNGEPAIRVKGAPHLEKPLTVEVKLPKRKPIKMTLEPTGKVASKAKATPAPQPEPAEQEAAADLVDAAESSEPLDHVEGFDPQ